ncbi:hypothetical protein VOLCADRAFT_91573 [Volvox carteri f. nagariensis]|uniref:STIL N-terminal domain-containing protein n=1 Tax=Volvox carteri f. nagariensis TaxID=3068 RepID=D8TXF4_VOLCA|nr:uncharacterized protein VOLCADRAFT_91573 [Volvox carteri f. nagariensis]EFJ47902.1 hypothetical protein VOLCADRAFT_91573 [Volvox carteri f. nagariensis]|eukprot:XP_002951008.1 hypothetical protein VOLCADRAFT_91573 [Volvox carteri f. nagariensis]
MPMFRSAAPGSLAVPLTTSTSGLSPDQLGILLQNLQHSLDQRGASRLTIGFALALALQTSGSIEPTGNTSRGSCPSTTLIAKLLLPAVTLCLTPLYAKRLCDVPLAQNLSHHQGPEAGVQVYSVPLVGVWVRGVRGTDHPAVYTAALQFAYGSTLPDRAVQSDGAFLLLIFTGESPVARCYEARFTDPSAQPQLQAHGRETRSECFSPAGGPNSTGGAAANGSGCSGFGGSGLRVLPYLVKAELTGQSAAPLELRPVLDTVTAAAAGPRLTLPHGRGPAGQTQQPSGQARGSVSTLEAAGTPRAGLDGTPSGCRPVSAPVPGSASRYDAFSIFQLRGSGSKLMTSPSKAMKILTGEGEAAYGEAGAVGCGMRGGEKWGLGNATGVRMPVAAPAHGLNGGVRYGARGPAAPPVCDAPGLGLAPGAGTLRDSPPVPRSSAAPTPFRTAPGPTVESGRSSGVVRLIAASVKGGGGSSSEGGDMLGLPRDPRLQYRAAAVEAPGERSAAAVSRRAFEGSTWTPSSRVPAPSSVPLAAGGSLPVLPAVRVSAAGVTSGASSLSRTGSTEWTDAASGVMGTPAAPISGRDSQFLAATPGQPHEPTWPHTQLQQQPYATGEEAMTASTVCGVTAWRMTGMVANGARGFNTARQAACATAPMAEAPVAAQQHPCGPVSTGKGLGQQPWVAASFGPEMASTVGADVTGTCSGTWCANQAAADSAGGPPTEKRVAAAASQSLDRWLQSSVQVTGYDRGSAMHTTGTVVTTSVAATSDTSAVGPATAAGNRGSYDSGYLGTDRQPTTASTTNLEHPAAGAPQAQPLQRPASADPHTRQESSLSLQRPPQQHPLTQTQKQPPGELARGHGLHRVSAAMPDPYRLQEPPRRPDTQDSRGELRGQELPHNLHSVQQPVPHAFQQLHLYQLPQEHTEQPPQQLPLQHTQPQSSDRWSDEQLQQRRPTSQAVLADCGEAVELSAPDGEGSDDLPMDPVLLKREVLQLRRQVASLQQKLRSVACTACQRLLITSGQENSTSSVRAINPEATCRLAAVAVTSTTTYGLRQASRQAELYDAKCDGMVSGGCESSSNGLTCKRQEHVANQQPGDGTPKSSRNSTACAASASVKTPGKLRPSIATTAGSASTEARPSGMAATLACSGGGVEYAAPTDASAIPNDPWVRQPAAAAAAAATASSVERVDRMSVFSEASDRASVWSMASLQSSILSYHSSTSRISADDISRGNNGFSSSGGGSIQSGSHTILRQDTCSEPLLQCKGANQSSGGVSSGSGRDDAVAQGGGHALPAHQAFSTAQPHERLLLNLNSRVCAAQAPQIEATPSVQSGCGAAAASASGGRSAGHLGNGDSAGLEVADRLSSPFQPNTTIRASADYQRLECKPRLCERASGGVVSRGQRRPRRTSSDSDDLSDHSMVSEADDVARPVRPSVPHSWRAEFPTALDRADHCNALPGNAAGANHTSISSSSGWSDNQPRVITAPPPQVSSGPTSAAVSIGPVIRTKYVPLDNDSDSSDSESDGLLEQKYGIRRTEL